jgi:hypothetical protein
MGKIGFDDIGGFWYDLAEAVEAGSSAKLPKCVD